MHAIAATGKHSRNHADGETFPAWRRRGNLLACAADPFDVETFEVRGVTWKPFPRARRGNLLPFRSFRFREIRFHVAVIAPTWKQVATWKRFANGITVETFFLTATTWEPFFEALIPQKICSAVVGFVWPNPVRRNVLREPTTVKRFGKVRTFYRPVVDQ